MKEALAAGRAEIRRRFENEAASGTQTVRAKAYLVDQMIPVVYDHADQRLYPLANPPTGQRLSLVAVGGHGHGARAPPRGHDLLPTLPAQPTPVAQAGGGGGRLHRR